jgi:hypothetical protein
MQRAYDLIFWWAAHVGVLSLPAFAWVRARGSEGFGLVLDVVAAFLLAMVCGRILELLRDQGRRLGEKEAALQRLLVALAGDGFVFMTCFVGWRTLFSAPGLAAPLVAASVLTLVTHFMRKKSKRLAGGLLN